jgi:iron(III) transport system substrate-binding protein
LQKASPRLPLQIAPALCLAIVTSACGAAGAGGAALTIYNGQHEQTTIALVKAFERASGLKVAVRSGDEATLTSQLEQEGSSSPADVFYTENTPPLEALRGHGQLASVAPATLGAVPTRYSSAQGRWVGVSARVSVLVYNTSQLAPAQLPGSILELAKPRWKGKLAFAPSESDFQPLVSSVAKLDGTAAAEAWLKGLQANARDLPDNETVTAQINAGQSALGPINHYYWYRLRREDGVSAVHSALHFYNPRDPGYLLNVSGAAVLRSSSHKAAAQKFLAFLVSPAGQRVLARSDSYEYPLRPGVAAPAGLRPLDQLQPAGLTPAELGDGSAALALEQKVGVL